MRWIKLFLVLGLVRDGAFPGFFSPRGMARQMAIGERYGQLSAYRLGVGWAGVILDRGVWRLASGWLHGWGGYCRNCAFDSLDSAITQKTGIGRSFEEERGATKGITARGDYPASHCRTD